MVTIKRELREGRAKVRSLDWWTPVVGQIDACAGSMRVCPVLASLRDMMCSLCLQIALLQSQFEQLGIRFRAEKEIQSRAMQQVWRGLVLDMMNGQGRTLIYTLRLK